MLRTVASPLLARGILNRPKQGFCVPLNDWLRRHFLPMFDGLCLAADARLRSFVDTPALLGQLRGPLGEVPRQDVYALLLLELWLRRVQEVIRVGT